MAKILGGYIGTKFEDFTIHPGLPDDDDLVPDSVDISCDIAGVHLRAPFFTAAMRSITGKELLLVAGKSGDMGVVPRGGTSIEQGVEMVTYVRDHEIKVGDVESETKPITVFDGETLGDARLKAKIHGHSNIPVITRKADFIGMFTYKPMKHDQLSPNIPITEVMTMFRGRGRPKFPYCTEDMSEKQIKNFLREGEYRFVPVIDTIGRLSRLVFLQMEEAYKVGAAIDTHNGWTKRAKALVEAGVDMMFIDTSDAHKNFSRAVVQKYKKLFPNGPPLCAGNIVTPEAFSYLAEAGADVVKVGMGTGSICLTNEVISAGAPSFSAVVRVSRMRDKFYKETWRYIPVIADGGIKSTHDLPVSLTHADGAMMGKLMGWFFESAGRKMLGERGEIVAVEIFGEASPQAYQLAGDMPRYTHGDADIAPFQGKTDEIPYMGRFKPGNEIYRGVVKEQLYHSGCKNLGQFRGRAVLERNRLKQGSART